MGWAYLQRLICGCTSSSCRWSSSAEVGSPVQRDQTVAVLETDKVNVDINSPEDGILQEVYANPGDTVEVDAKLFKLNISAGSACKPQRHSL